MPFRLLQRPVEVLAHNAWSIMENAAPKKFVLFVQPEAHRNFKFMELYRSGFVAQWVRDIGEARKVMGRVFDVVVVDLNFQPNDSLSFCRELKRADPKRLVVALSGSTVVQASPERCLDLVLPSSISLDGFLRQLDLLRSAGDVSQE